MKKRSFTLIELLVVIAIIAVLAGLLLPALSASRKTAQRIACTSNMRNVYQGCLLYVTDFDSWLPYTSSNADYSWYINQYVNQSRNGGYEYISATSQTRSIAFGKPSGVFFCPSLSSPPESSFCWMSAGTANPNNSYMTNYMATVTWGWQGLNSGCWLNYASDGSTLVNNRRLDSIKDGCVIVGDQNWSGYYSAGSVYQCGTPMSGDPSGYSLTDTYRFVIPGWMHNLASNFLFKDGHVKSYHYISGISQFDSNYIPKQ